jgi:hypothetical protein
LDQKAAKIIPKIDEKFYWDRSLCQAKIDWTIEVEALYTKNVILKIVANN